MVQGLSRRALSETNADRSLRSMATIEPVTLPQSSGAGGVRRIASPRVTSDFTSEVANSLGEYAQASMGEAVKKKQERAMMDGAMAEYQGKTFEEVQMGGDKWALEGYRLVEAQGMASSLLVAQRQEIDEGLYENDPDAYRAHFMNRVDGVLGSSSDPRTSELAKEQLLKQMPTLVEDHMTKHLAWKEQKNFDTLAKSVDTISLDPTSGPALIAFANGGEGSPTAGLSEERRHEAITSGLVEAFQNDNPSAYAILGNSGALKALTPTQRDAIEGARKRFEQRRRETVDADFMKAEADLMEKIATGGFAEPQMAVEAYTELLKDRDITITAAEAGEVYSGAQNGTRAKNTRTAALVEDAFSRGDRSTMVRVITGSLMSTESGGNTQAFRTNADGRSYGGQLQFGQARLDDYNKANGTSWTVDDVRGMNAADQQVIGDWHINEILDHIEERGYDKIIGQQINGVEVTRAGMVAVAHLGGQGGLDAYIDSNGASDPQDELGTSLTDYMRKHGTGVFMDPAAIREQTDKRIEVVRERAAVDLYEQTQPQFDAADAEYLKTGDEEKWRKERERIHEEFSITKTMRMAEAETATMRKYQEELEKKQKELAKAGADEAKQQALVEAHKETVVAQTEFDDVLTKFKSGEASTEDLLAAQAALQQQQAGIQKRYNLPTNSTQANASLDAQVKKITGAMDDRRKYEEDGVMIARAAMSGTVAELPAKLQERALKDARAAAQEKVQDAVASGTVTPEAAGDELNAEMLKFYSKSGLIDPMMERTMNGFLSGGLLNPDGSPRPEYVEAATQYRSLSLLNQTVADKFVRPENRAELDAVLDVAAGGPIEGAVRTIGIRKKDAPRLTSPEQFRQDPNTISLVDDAVDTYFSRQEIGLGQVMSPFREADLGQLADRSWFERYDYKDEQNVSLLRERVVAEVMRDYSANPTIRPSELVSKATARVTDHTPVLGGIAVPLSMKGPGAGEMFFGARAADFSDRDGVYNTMLMDYFRSEEFQTVYPQASGTTLQESLPSWMPDTFFGMFNIKGESGSMSDALHATWTGVRPYQVYPTDDGGLSVIFSLPQGGYTDAIKLDTRAIGNKYMAAQTALAAD